VEKLPRVSPSKGLDMKKRPKPKVRPVDYHLECWIEARFWKIASTGRKREDLKRIWGI